jgi:hypothetical protein
MQEVVPEYCLSWGRCDEVVGRALQAVPDRIVLRQYRQDGPHYKNEWRHPEMEEVR